jgi:hypothetical protein
MSRIKFELQDVNLFYDTHWGRMNEFFVAFLLNLCQNNVGKAEYSKK